MVLAASTLQLAGLMVAVWALTGKGKLFGKSHPVAMLREWLGRTLRPPVTLELGRAPTLGKARAMTRASPLDVTVRHRTLKERVDRLDAEVTTLRHLIATEEEERLWEDYHLRSLISEATGENSRAIAEGQHRAREMAVGSYTWEWVSLGWIFVGTLLDVLSLAGIGAPLPSSGPLQGQ